MLDFDANLLLLFDQRDFAAVQGSLETIGFRNFYTLEVSENLGAFVIENRIDYIFATVELLEDHRFVPKVKEIHSKWNSVPLIFCFHQFDEKVCSVALDLPFADMVRFNFEYGDLIRAFYHIKQKMSYSESSKRKYIFVKKNKLIVKLTVTNIQYIKVEGKYLELYTRDNIYLIRATLQAILSELPAQFIKIHQSYGVNLDHVDSIDVHENVVLINGGRIPMSRNLKREFLARFYIA